MIEILGGSVFYKLETKFVNDYKERIIEFLKMKGVPSSQLLRLDIDFVQNIGGKIDLAGKDFKLTLRILHDRIVLLFETQMDSDQFNEFTANYFV